VAIETVRAIQGGARVDAHAPLIPARVRDLIADRLERLTPAARDLVGVAAAVGRAFEFPLLCAAAALDPEPAAVVVEELVARRVLQAVDEQLAFVHERIRDVAYAALLPPRRRLLHGQIFAALETLYAADLEPHTPALATHARAGEIWDKAVHYLVRVARRAARSFAHAEAVAMLEEARALTAHLPEAERAARQLEIVPSLVRSLFFVNRSREGRDLLLPERERVEALGNPWLSGRFHLLLAMTHFSLGETAETTASARRAIADAESCDDVSTIGKASYILCGESVWPGRFAEGVAHGRRAVACLERSGDAGWLALAWCALGVNHSGLGEFEAALAAGTTASRLAEAIGDPRAQSMANWLSGVVFSMRRDVAEAIETCQRAVALAPDRLNRTLASGFLGYAFLAAEEYDRVIPLLEEVLAELGESWPQYRGWFMAFLSEARLMTGDLAAARALATEGLALSTRAGYTFGVAWAERMLGWVHRAAGERAEAERAVARAFALFEATGARSAVAELHMDLAVLAHDGGKDALARDHLARARRLFAELDVPRYVERTDALSRRLFE
jgi:tetratricopeptide (TPR) repeat protein